MDKKEMSDIDLRDYLKEKFDALDKRFDKLEDNDKEIKEDLNHLQLDRARQDLAHINLKEDVDHMNKDIEGLKKDLKPVVSHVEKVQFIVLWTAKILGGSGIIAILGFIIKNIVGV